MTLILTEMDVSGQSCKKYEKEFPYLITLVISNKQMTLCRFVFLLMHLVTKKRAILGLLMAVVNIIFFPQIYPEPDSADPWRGAGRQLVAKQVANSGLNQAAGITCFYLSRGCSNWVGIYSSQSGA